MKPPQRVMLTPGQVVKELRLKKGWTQKTLSEITEIAVANISNIESDRSRLGEERAIILAAAFEVRPEFILFPNGFEREDMRVRIKAIRRRLKRKAS